MAGPASRALLVALLLAASAAGAAELGTLFHSPEERARLERLRRGEAPAEGASTVPGAAEVTGYVKRSDGRDTVWVDGVAVPLRDPRAARELDPRIVRSQSRNEAVRVERKPPG